MNPKDGYLILYNTSCSFGWAIVLLYTILSIVTNVNAMGWINALAQVYNDPQYGTSLSLTLTIVQTAAFMEIMHAMLQLVRSPVLVTAMQVMSRIVALVAISFSHDAQSKF
jgi:very-long-chain (3R)-3-hydroxyacyl-CoA dehydratase